MTANSNELLGACVVPPLGICNGATATAAHTTTATVTATAPAPVPSPAVGHFGDEIKDAVYVKRVQMCQTYMENMNKKNACKRKLFAEDNDEVKIINDDDDDDDEKPKDIQAQLQDTALEFFKRYRPLPESGATKMPQLIEKELRKHEKSLLKCNRIHTHAKSTCNNNNNNTSHTRQIKLTEYFNARKPVKPKATST